MNVALQPAWTQERFLLWAEAQDEPYEFDGEQPVAMTRGNNNHNRLIRNILGALDRRLDRAVGEALGPEAGIQTANGAVRYPDVVVTRTPIDGLARLVCDPVILFEIPSRNSYRNDRIVKVREYGLVPTVRRYIIVELGLQALTVLTHGSAGVPWTTFPLGEGETLALPEIGVELPLLEIYDRVNFELTQED